MKHYFTILTLACALELIPALAAAYPGGSYSLPTAGSKQRLAKNCQPGSVCQEQRRLRNLRLREAVKDGDMPAEQVHHQSRRLMPPANLDAQSPAVQGQSNFWRDKLKKAQEQNQSE